MKRPFVESHIAGDTLEMSLAKGNAVSVAGYPASDGWTLKYRLAPKFTSPTQAPIDITATTDTDGESYKVLVDKATTAAWKSGAYSWARWVETSTARVTLDVDGQLDILPDPSLSAQGDDRRSHARKMLEQIEAAIEAFTTNMSVKSYTIGTRSLTRRDMPELLKLRSDYKWFVKNEIDAEKVAAGLPNPRRVGVRFN